MSAASRFNIKKRNTNQRTTEHNVSQTALVLRNGGIAVIRTDTLYGIVGSALRKDVVERMYRLKKRGKDKPFIILIGRIADVKLFGITPSRVAKKAMATLWPGKNSLIMETSQKEELRYLHRGGCTLAFRLPDDACLRSLLKATGPLVAPSANSEGERPAATIHEAEQYFGKRVDAYVDGGRIRTTRPSKVFSVTDSVLKRLR